MGNAKEGTECLVCHAGVDAAAFRKDALMVVWLLYFDEGERETIDEDGKVRTELVLGLVIAAGELGCYMSAVVVFVVEVYELEVVLCDAGIEFSSKVVIATDT